jgi:hypothetical protein
VSSSILERASQLDYTTTYETSVLRTSNLSQFASHCADIVTSLMNEPLEYSRTLLNIYTATLSVRFFRLAV